MHEENETVHWIPPQTDEFKMNIDAAEGGDLSWGIAAIFRDHKGEVLAAATWKKSFKN